MIDINGVAYIPETPEHGTVRGRRARLTIDGVPHVRADLVRRRATGLSAYEFVDLLRGMSFDAVILNVREMVSHDGRLFSREGSGAEAGTLISLFKGVGGSHRVTLDGVPVIGYYVQDENVLLKLEETC